MPSLYVEIMSPILFLICWILIAFHIPWFPIGRTGGTMVCAVLTVALGILSSSEAFAAISLETLSLLFGSMLMSAYLEREGFFLLVQKGLCWRISNEGGYAAHKLLLRVCLLSGGLSALVTNDTTCVVLTPLLMGMVTRHSLPPAPFLLALATSANIGSSCSPVGNPQNMLIASASGLEFKTFLSTIFVSMAISMAINIVLLLLVYNKQLHGCNIVWTEAIFERVDDNALSSGEDEKKNGEPVTSISSDPAREHLLSDRSTQHPTPHEEEENSEENKKEQPSDSHVVDIPLSIQLDSEVSPLPAERKLYQRQMEDSVRSQLQQAVEVQERIETALHQGEARVSSPSEIQLARVVVSNPSPSPKSVSKTQKNDTTNASNGDDHPPASAAVMVPTTNPYTQLNLQEEWARNEYIRRMQLSFFYSIEINQEGEPALVSTSSASVTATMNIANPPLTYSTPARYALPTFVVANRRNNVEATTGAAESKKQEVSGLRMVPPEYEKISSPYTAPNANLAAHSSSPLLPLHSALHKYRSIPRLYIFSFILLVTVITFLVGLPLSWCALGGGLAMVLVDHKDPDVSEIWRQIDWSLLLFFSALFIVVEGLHASGWPQKAWDATQSSMNLGTAGGVAIFTLLVILGSNTVSNVPLVLILTPALKVLPDKQQKTAWLLLAFVSTLAGNLTLIGSVANLIVAARARKWYTLTFWEYTKFGLPSTLLVLLIGTPIIPAIINA